MLFLRPRHYSQSLCRFLSNRKKPPMKKFSFENFEPKSKFEKHKDLNRSVLSRLIEQTGTKTSNVSSSGLNIESEVTNKARPPLVFYNSICGLRWGCWTFKSYLSITTKCNQNHQWLSSTWSQLELQLSLSFCSTNRPLYCKTFGAQLWGNVVDSVSRLNRSQIIVGKARAYP